MASLPGWVSLSLGGRVYHVGEPGESQALLEPAFFSSIKAGNYKACLAHLKAFSKNYTR